MLGSVSGHSILLISLSSPAPIPHCFNYYRFQISLRFRIVQSFLGPLLSHTNFRIILLSSLKNPVGIFSGLALNRHIFMERTVLVTLRLLIPKLNTSLNLFFFQPIVFMVLQPIVFLHKYLQISFLIFFWVLYNFNFIVNYFFLKRYYSF